ncbi:hypothetical protein EDD27_10604 [Nonomuraea polychroma]|uniref:Uncharacterized protein n=2 Tax=Nonomuraea polychroma TaxID=46176 RepID=A0A438MP40_9ACTN|nr:hypothetical protein EDD27_10604 [Nonomuraea polychroma]
MWRGKAVDDVSKHEQARRPLCVTGEAYRDRPPKAKGWQQSGEMRFHSPTGVLEFFGDGGDLLGDVTAAGAGSYRIRAYVRGVERAPDLDKAEAIREVLIVVFPTAPR